MLVLLLINNFRNEIVLNNYQINIISELLISGANL